MEKVKLNLKDVYDIDNPPITECPYCGCGTYYYKQSYSGTGNCYRNFDGSEADNADMYVSATYKEIGKFAYCADCNKKLFSFKA